MALLLLLFSLYSLPTHSLSVHDLYRHAFGADKYSTHFTDETSFSRALENNISSPGTTILCSDYNSGYVVHSALAAVSGGSVHTLYTSSKHDTTCFIMYQERDLTLMELLGISATRIRLVSRIPWQMKIHHSAMYHLGMTAGTEIHRVLSDQFRSPEPLNMEEASLMVSVGVGSHTEGLKSVDYTRESLLRILSSSHPSDHLQRVTSQSVYRAFTKPSNSPESIWVNAAAEARSAKGGPDDDACDLTNLDMTSDDTGSILIKNLHRIHVNAGAVHAQNDSPLLTPGRGHLSPQACFASLLAAVASDPNVIDIRLRGPRKVMNRNGKGIVQTNSQTASYPYLDAGLNGEGQVVGVGDSGVDELSCFFANSDLSLVARSSYKNPTHDNSKRVVIQYVNYMGNSDVEGGHGTHVCGTVAGSNGDDDYNGHASSAKIAFFDMSRDGNYIFYPSPLSKNVFDAAYSAGAKLHSNSWGSDSNQYDTECLDIDAYHVNTPDFLAIFAAGNAGEGGYYTLGNPAVSKNALAVGASMSSPATFIDNIAYFSSLGPSFDGRIKPDVVAPGYATYSAYASGSASTSCSYIAMSGTSMATPAVTGNAALIRQYFEDNDFWASICDSSYTSCGAFSPLGATVKAVLIHSGEAMLQYYSIGATTEPTALLTSPPDSYQGFGRVSLMNVLPYPGIEDVIDLFVEELTVVSLQRVSYTVQLSDSSRPLKATVVWMDPPNTVASAKLLLHDIDLTVTAPDGTVYYGNGVAGDEVNNVEQVSVSSPVSGTYTVSITCKVLSQSISQSVSVVITSAGSVTGQTTSVVSSSFVSNELGCSSNEKMVTVYLMDNGGDGWGNGNSFEIVDSTGTTIETASMTGSTNDDSFSVHNFCLDDDETYTARLLTSGSKSKEMGVDIPQCSIYLSRWQSEDTLTLNSGTCNQCTSYNLGVTLVGPTSGVPYGWKDTSKYIVVDGATGNGTTIMEGTLVTGILSTRDFCLPNGQYVVEFNDVPESDDFEGGSDGVDSYRIALTNCNSAVRDNDELFDDDVYPVPMIPPGGSFTITLSSSECTYEITGDNVADSSGSARVLPSMQVILLISGLLTTALLLVFV